MDTNTIYIDELNVPSLFWLIRRARKVKTIFYFDSTRPAMIAIRLLRTFLKPGAVFQRLEFHLSEIRSEDGACLFEQLYGQEPASLCDRIADACFPKNPLIDLLSKTFGRAEIRLYLEKKIDRSIRSYVIFMEVVSQHAVRGRPDSPAPAVFLLSHYFADFLGDFARDKNIRVESYTHLFRQIRRMTRVMWRLIWPVLSLKGLWMPPGRRMDSPHAILAGFNGKTITFDPAKRSDFFWLIPESVPRSQVMIYFDRQDYPLTRSALAPLLENRMGYVAGPAAKLSENMPQVFPGFKAAVVCGRWSCAVIRMCLEFLTRRAKWPGTFYLDLALDFIRHYARWTDFFSRYGIRIAIHIDDFSDDSVPFHLALRDAGGVSVSYQYSSLYIPSRLMSICRDVYFSFGPHYKSYFDQNHSMIGDLVYTGYITDQSFAPVGDAAMRHREKLIKAGAKFIVCFFDENSSDDRMCVVSNPATVKIYESFLNSVLSDPTLGLIVKPGYPRTLFSRLPQIRPLADRAKATGRCVFLDEGTVVTDVLPTEAAQAADMAVGFLFSGTAIMESYLSGTPSVYLDLEKLVHRPEYQWSHRVVYESLEDLWSAIREYRRDPAAHPEFGDLSPTIDDRDPFRDGRAALRIAEYIRWLLESLNSGNSRGSAIAEATRKYRERWGGDKIVRRLKITTGEVSMEVSNPVLAVR